MMQHYEGEKTWIPNVGVGEVIYVHGPATFGVRLTEPVGNHYPGELIHFRQGFIVEYDPLDSVTDVRDTMIDDLRECEERVADSIAALAPGVLQEPARRALLRMQNMCLPSDPIEGVEIFLREMFRRE